MSDIEEEQEPSTNLEKNIASPSLEYILLRTGEECEAWSKLHLMSHKKFKKRETMFNLPIITITAFIGFISGLNLDYEYIHIILGGMSLYASLLKSYFSYLKISQKSENHRIAYIQYGQIANEIRLEMALEPAIRKPISMLLDLIRIKMRNLHEVSEIIESHVVNDYLSRLDPAYSKNFFIRWFWGIRPQLIRPKRAEHKDQPDDSKQLHEDVGRPNILKLANRFESYVDIENKVIKMQGPSPSGPQSPGYFRRSSSGMSPSQRNMITAPPPSNSQASSEADAGSNTNELILRPNNETIGPNDIIIRAPDGSIIGTMTPDGSVTYTRTTDGPVTGTMV